MRNLDALDPQDLETLYTFGITPKKFKQMRRGKRLRWVRYAAAVFLAVVCVAGAELMACRFYEPELYEAIMEPVRETAHQAALTAQAAWRGVRRAGAAAANTAGEAASALAERGRAARDSLRAWMEELTAPPEVETTDSVLAQPEIEPYWEEMDPLVSNLVQRDGLWFLTGGGVDVVYYNQTDESRAEQMYGTDPLSTHGCGPTAMAMAVSTLTEETVDPEDMAKLCVEQGYWCKSHGSYLSIVQGIAGLYGLDCQSVDLTALDEDSIYAHLAAGDLIVALMTKGHFTKGGHFILLRGVILSGEILVADPASQDRSLIPWDLSLILDELSPNRGSGSPLWILSKPAE